MSFLLSPNSWFAEKGLAIVRIITGALLIYHGWEVFDAEVMKTYAGWDTIIGFSSPATMAYFGKGAELVAGILLLFGLLTRIACLITIGVMIYITFIIGHGKFWYEDQHPFMFILIAAVFLFTGPGRYSLDHLLFRKKKRY